MHEELVIAGAGGQGILFIGELISLAAIEEEKHTTWFPSYGPTMRGGKANCTVIVSSDEIGSPAPEHPDSLIAMNNLSLLEFVDTVKPGGLIIINKSLADWNNSRGDVEVLEIKASDMTKELGDHRAANLVILGVYLKKKGIVSFENIKKALRDIASEKGLSKNLAELNEKALQRGFEEAI